MRETSYQRKHIQVHPHPHLLLVEHIQEIEYDINKSPI